MTINYKHLVYALIIFFGLTTTAIATTTQQCATELDGLIADTHSANFTGSKADQNEASLVRKLVNADRQFDGDRLKNTIRKVMAYRDLVHDLIANGEIDLSVPSAPDLIEGADDVISCIDAIGLPAAIARIVIQPSGMLFTGINDSVLLMAQAYDTNDQPIPNVVFSWSSNNTTTISVDSGGIATAQSSLGSAQITAAADGVISQPITALVATPVPNAILIDDNQVLVSPNLVDPNADLDIGMQFVTTLDGTTTLQVGDIIVGTGAEPIGGVVVSSAVQNDGTVIVTYELVPLDNLFTSLKLNETYDLSKITPELGEDANGLYDIQDLGNGAVVLTLKPAVTTLTTTDKELVSIQAASTFNLGPFKCEATATPPFNLTSNPGSLTVTNTATLTVAFAVPTSSVTDLELARLDGEIRADFKAELSLTSQLSGEVKCEAPNMISLTIPLGGPMFVLSPTINLGPNVALGGKVETQSLGFILSANAGANGFTQFHCPNSSTSPCTVGADLSAPTPKADYKIDVPDPAALAGLKIQPEVSAGVTGTVSFGLPPRFKLLNGFFGKLTIEAVKSSLSLKQFGDLAFVDTQILDDTYASNYKLAYEWEAGPGSDIEKIVKLVSFLLGADALKVSGGDDLATSPVAASTTADRDLFNIGDTINFMVDLDVATTNYPFINYNVDQIKIYRKSSSNVIDMVTQISATPNQTSFTIPWVADTNDSFSDTDFYAFVTTNAFPVPFIDALELGLVNASPICSLDDVTGFWRGPNVPPDVPSNLIPSGWSGSYEEFFIINGQTIRNVTEWTDTYLELQFVQVGSAISGVVANMENPGTNCVANGTAFTGTFDGTTINFTIDNTANNNCGESITFTGTLQECEISAGGIDYGIFSGTHTVEVSDGASGTWRLVGPIGD